jgi:regulatory protein YycI of two-component signal transduction system YycFG
MNRTEAKKKAVGTVVKSKAIDLESARTKISENILVLNITDLILQTDKEAREDCAKFCENRYLRHSPYGHWSMAGDSLAREIRDTISEGE